MNPNQDKQARLIIFEGIDGSGKTTQLEKAKVELETKGLSVYQTRNLGGSEIGEALRKIVTSNTKRPPMTDFYLSLAIQEAMIEQVDSIRKQYDLILLDRSAISLVAYQCYGSGIDTNYGWEQVNLALERLRPDLILLYQLDVPTALQRARQQSGVPDYFESKSEDFFERVASGYEEANKRYRPRVIDTTQSIDECLVQTMAAIENLLAT